MKHTCDFCGNKKEVVTTKYGSTRYTRLVCKDCIARINAYHLLADGKCVLKNNGEFEE